MGKTVILSERNGEFMHWATQFVRADSSNRAVVVLGRISNHPTQEQKNRFINTYYGRAAEIAGEGGRLIISLGHGSSSDTDSSIGMVDLLPHRTLRVQREHVMYEGSETETGDDNVLARVTEQSECRRLFNRYDFDESTSRPAPPDEDAIALMNCMGARSATIRKNFHQAYMLIGRLIHDAGLAEVIFLTCRVGNATNFVDRIAMNWRVDIVAYELRVAANRDDEANPYYIYLVGEEDRIFRDQIPSRHQYRSNSRSTAE